MARIARHVKKCTPIEHRPKLHHAADVGLMRYQKTKMRCGCFTQSGIS